MDDIFVARLMSADVQSVTADTLVETAAEAMIEDGIGSLVVVDDAGRVEGILTTTDFVGIVAESQPKAETTVERYMSTDVVTVGAQMAIRDAADTMIEHGFHHLPVVDDDGGVVGMLTTADLAAYLSHVQTPSPSE